MIFSFYRLQHGFLLSATHQILEKLVTETQEEMSLRQGGENNLTKLLQDAENCKQLLPKLQDAVRCDPHHIEVRLSKLKLELHSAIKHYLKVSIYLCRPLLLRVSVVLYVLKCLCRPQSKHLPGSSFIPYSRQGKVLPYQLGPRKVDYLTSRCET